MRYLSVCSGIEAATCAWHPLGWTPVGFSEIEKFPSAVLAHHYPTVPNFGDMTRFQEWPDDLAPSLLVGGTPCQSFSVAGLRKGLADPRGNLALTYLALADRYRPDWLVWENVPGVLSSGGGRDFGAFLGAMGKLGYGFAYRVLDAQYFGVAQRRRRVFVVANSRSWRRAAAVLYEPESLRGDLAPRRETGQGVAGTVAASLARGSAPEGERGGLIPSLVGSLTARGGRNGGIANDDVDGGRLLAFGGNNTSGPIEITPSLLAQPGSGWKGGFDSETFIAFDSRQECISSTECFGALSSSSPQSQAVAFAQNSRDELREMPYVGALAADPGMKQTSYVRQDMSVRRLTPRECERLQGFPDDYTDIRPRGKVTKDRPRYKALGNSIAVPCMAWIGKRIAAVAAQ